MKSKNIEDAKKTARALKSLEAADQAAYEVSAAILLLMAISATQFAERLQDVGLTSPACEVNWMLPSLFRVFNRSCDELLRAIHEAVEILEGKGGGKK